jgi:two-component system sensor histidine kinase DegS
MTDPLLTALETERRYVARELHDGLAQTTLQLGLQAGLCRKLLERNRLDMLAQELAQLEMRAQLASTQVREIIADMRPPQVELEADLKDYLQQVIDTHLERGGPPVTYQFQWTEKSPDLSPDQRLALARAVQEALANVRKHAGARQVEVVLSEDSDKFFVAAADDGCGFDPTEIRPGLVDKGGAGLTNLRTRIEAIGGQVSIESGSEGTKITVTLSE